MLSLKTGISGVFKVLIIIMVTYGMDVKKLQRSKETTAVQKIEEFFKRKKDKAYRGCELEKIFNEHKKTTVRNAIRVLHERGLTIKKQLGANKTFYFWNTIFEKSPKKVSFVGTEIIRRPKKVTFKLKGKK